ncbi:hypothetical protein Scep_003179 [Stephania cephalantha]|uniref:Bifunctional inhibitor/plant lipid transfer protein/seed storage helical domain-containing protein n=1 Tax=Stephania cephalantha TaxID=152367 RepID=A0AAP0KQZ1_9MAGN
MRTRARMVMEAVQLHNCFNMKLPFMLVMLILVLVMGFVSSADYAEDRKECTSQLIGLATCLPYVGGSAKAPTPECCKGLETVLSMSKKCLCVLVKDRNDPNIGFKINSTLALKLPSICKSAISIADCPDKDFSEALLHLDPNSPDAQVFNQYEKSLHSKSPPASANSTTTQPSSDSKKDNSGIKAGISWFLLMLCLTSMLIM